MSETNKSYRIKTDVGTNLTNGYITIDANLVQDYDTFDILSVKIDSADTYKLHNANYGVVVGRVLANNGFGIPNAKLSIFISADGEDGEKVRELYPFSSTASKDRKGVRYNLLPDNQVGDCHQIVGTFPNKRYALDNDVILEVFDKYYKYTTRTNNAGDYMIMGVPVGTHTLHMDLDLSDCGILSQRPRDFVYKGYTIEQFENPNMFKEGTTYSNLSQIFTQDQVVNVQPFWGNSSLGEEIGITRADIDVAFKFEPTCVFIGSVVSDNSSQGISKKCIATENMGNMEELTTGEGTIEMIRKTPGGAVEEFQVKGTQLIDGNGVWCYQIPMNLDYMMTDEYGNMVPTDDPEKGIPTRTKVRFRVSMQDNEENVDNYFRAKVLVPHNPQNLENGQHEEYDYEFGSLTRDDSFRDLFWNNVYSVKSYIPRFQKRKVGGWKEKKFTGIKNCNFYGSNNPMPYNNIRIKLPFMFTVMCALIKIFIFIISIVNTFISMWGNFLSDLGDTRIGWPDVWIFGWNICWWPFRERYKDARELSMNVLKEGLCPDLENWYFAPMFKNNLWSPSKSPPPNQPPYDLLKQTLDKLRLSSADDDIQSIDVQNNEETEDGEEEPICLTVHTDYLIACVEMNLAMEYRVINFDFYNDWVNGTLYFPRFMRYLRPKKTFLGITFARAKIKGCMDDTKIFAKTRRYTQQCSIGYKNKIVNNSSVYTDVKNPLSSNNKIKAVNNLHKQRGISQKTIFGRNGGICHEHSTMKGQFVYYMKPCEWTYETTPNNRKVNLFATDIILLGSLNNCDLNGIPQAFKYLSSTSYIMPTNLALTNMESNGWLYTTQHGTICYGQSKLSESDMMNGSKVTVASPNSGITKEIEAFEGAKSENYNTQYDGDELSDIIALTEAAGIAWNYTGPGQGEMNPEKFYYPGGHFLGLSCVNSQTNIKSCINLSRICEVGSNMSQRKEDISSIDKNGVIKHTYTAPTGFISGDDIVGSNFRTMFATMNYKRLIADKTNPVTGYKMYDFNFVKPINFDGTFKNIVDDNSLYNGKVKVPEEDPSVFEKIGILLGKDRKDLDYDELETGNTQTRTIEETSIDYYLYRFGLDYNELKKNNQKQQRRFLITNGNEMFLPQYENSYYFYFGLKNGATAIDEFNKQFFSECENGKLVEKEPTVNISVYGDIKICNGSADIIVSTNNIDLPYKYISYYSDINPEVIYIQEGGENSNFLNQYSFILEDMPFATYTVTVRDSYDNEYTKTTSIGMDLVSFESVSYDFNTDNDGNIADSLIHRGGYVEISNLYIKELERLGFTGTKLSIVLKNESGGVEKTISGITNGGNETRQIPIPKSNETYLIFVEYRCNGGSEQEILLQKIRLKNGSNIKLCMGNVNHEMDISYGFKKGEEWYNKRKYSWIEKICTFNNFKEYGKKTFSNRIFAEGGTKVVWGLAQNSNGIYTDKIYCTENNIEVIEGYSIDDDYSYYPTLTYNGEEVTHFSALAYNGTNVMGSPMAYKKDGRYAPLDARYFDVGYGYIIKPLPEGDLLFLDGVPSGGETEYENCLYYPSVVYPVLKRPFYLEGNFYIWQDKNIELSIGENGIEEVNVVNGEMSGKVECTIYNGITDNNGHFSTNSFISFWNSSISANPNTVKDESGVKNNINRKIEINNKSNYFSTSTTNIYNVGYNIIEGCNNETDLELVGSISDNISNDFCNYIAYTMNSEGKVDSFELMPEQDESSDNDYFLCIQKKDDEYKLLESSGFVAANKTMYIHFILCTYTSAATFNNEGDYVIVTASLPAMTYYFNVLNEDGETKRMTVYLGQGATSLWKGDYEHALSGCTWIKPVKKYVLRKDIKSNFCDIIEKHKSNYSQSSKYIQDGDILYGCGIKKNENGLKFYKIYTNLTKVSELQGEKYVKLQISPDELTFYETGSRNININDGGNNTGAWKIKGNVPGYINITPSTGVGTTDVTVTLNNFEDGRKTKIDFYIYENDIKTLIIKEEAKETPDEPDTPDTPDEPDTPEDKYYTIDIRDCRVNIGYNESTGSNIEVPLANYNTGVLLKPICSYGVNVIDTYSGEIVGDIGIYEDPNSNYENFRVSPYDLNDIPLNKYYYLEVPYTRDIEVGNTDIYFWIKVYVTADEDGNPMVYRDDADVNLLISNSSINGGLSFYSTVTGITISFDDIVQDAHSLIQNASQVYTYGCLEINVRYNDSRRLKLMDNNENIIPNDASIDGDKVYLTSYIASQTTKNDIESNLHSVWNNVINYIKGLSQITISYKEE